MEPQKEIKKCDCQKNIGEKCPVCISSYYEENLPQKENWEERFDVLFNENGDRDYSNIQYFISKERLLAQKEFGERLLALHHGYEDLGEHNDGMSIEYISVEDIEAEIKELGV